MPEWEINMSAVDHQRASACHNNWGTVNQTPPTLPQHCWMLRQRGRKNSGAFSATSHAWKSTVTAASYSRRYPAQLSPWPLTFSPHLALPPSSLLLWNKCACTRGARPLIRLLVQKDWSQRDHVKAGDYFTPSIRSWSVGARAFSQDCCCCC